MKEKLEQFPAQYQQPVAWGDMDALGHVNNVIYYRYIESARIHYFKQMDLFSHKISMVISKSSCHYLSPVIYPDTLIIGARVEEIRSSAMRMSYALYSESQGHIVATGEAVMVCLDLKTQQKTQIPVSLKQLILDFERSIGHTPVQI